MATQQQPKRVRKPIPISSFTCHMHNPKTGACMGAKTFDNQSYAWSLGYEYATTHYTAISNKGKQLRPKRVEKIDGNIFAVYTKA